MTLDDEKDEEREAGMDGPPSPNRPARVILVHTRGCVCACMCVCVCVCVLWELA